MKNFGLSISAAAEAKYEVYHGKASTTTKLQQNRSKICDQVEKSSDEFYLGGTPPKDSDEKAWMQTIF